MTRRTRDGAVYGDVFTDIADANDKLHYLPSDPELLAWFNPSTGEWEDAVDVDWTRLQHTHQLIPIAGDGDV